MDILAVQQRFIDAGFQFVEHVYNDGNCRNCQIKFTRDTSPHCFTPDRNLLGDFGWGRFSRMEAWRQAAEWLDRLEERAAHRP